jgi:hypothetical protein
MSSLTQAPQTSGLPPRRALRAAMVSRLSIHPLPPHSVPPALRSQSHTAAVKLADPSQRMLSRWPASKSASRSLVRPHNYSRCLVLVTIRSGVCNQIAGGLLSSPVSGLMGLAWQPLAASGATPFWQALYQGNVFDEPVMAFYLTRFQNVTNVQQEEPGGVFTMGLSQHRSTISLSLLHVRWQAQPTRLSIRAK